jgi:hypothetical protein
MLPASVRSLIGGLGVAAAALSWAPTALAQRDEVTAAAQFDKGLADMEAGRYTSGCPALAESYRLDPKPGALFTLAECEAKWGKIASAIAHYDDFASLLARLPRDLQSRDRDRLRIAAAQSKALGLLVPELTLVLPPSAPPGAVVKRDGVALGRPSLGVPLPVDPGEHVVVVENEGASREERITVAKGEKLRVDLRLPEPVASPSRPPAEAPRVKPPAPPLEEARSSGHSLTYIAFGVGTAALFTGAITGALVLGKKGTIETHCANTSCDATGLDAARSARTLGLVSTIGFGVAAAGTALGLVLLATDSRPAPRRTAIHPAVVPLARGGVLGAEGAW